MSKIIQKRHLPKTIVLFLILIIFSSIISLHFNSAFAQRTSTGINNTLIASSSSLHPPVIVDPNPKLIEKKSGNLINDITLASSINTIRNGTIADGVSKLLLITSYKNPINFSIADDANLSKGTLNSLSDNSNSLSSSSHSSVIIKSQITTTGIPVVAAVYTPPSILTNLPPNKNNEIVKVLIHDNTNPSANTEVLISLYRVPVILVHGIWSNSTESWVKTKFKDTLEKSGYAVFLANYGTHNAETFDPYALPIIGNHGIDSIRNIINFIMNSYHNNGIATSQVDAVGHSMGGLMVRGFAQQPDYKNPNNFMQGYIHHLITIGTPHYGGHLASILINNQNNDYCVSSIPPFVFNSIECGIFVPEEPLKTIFADVFKLPIDKGGVGALVPNSTAYSHLCQTNVPSYAIAGSWAPNADNSHSQEQLLYRNILVNPFFNLDIDGFRGNSQGDNDLQVSIASQLGGLNGAKFRSITNSTIPNHSEIYHNTVHSSTLIQGDQNVMSDLNSPFIQKDVATLLHSQQNKFTNAIGIGSPCQIPR